MYKNVIIPVDLSDNKLWEEIIYKTLNLIDLNLGKVHIIHIIPELSMNLFEEYLPQEWLENKKAEAKTSMQKLVVNYFPQEVLTEQFVTKGSVADEILNYSDKVQADLIILTSSTILGSVAKKVTKNASTSVLILRTK